MKIVGGDHPDRATSSTPASPIGCSSGCRSSCTRRRRSCSLLNVLLLLVGCLMDIFSAIVVVVPLIVPAAAQFHIDPYHLGVIFLLNLEIGYLLPPAGLNLFIAGLPLQPPDHRALPRGDPVHPADGARARPGHVHSAAGGGARSRPGPQVPAATAARSLHDIVPLACERSSRACRPRQWVKNLFVAAPLVFAKRLTDPRAVAARARRRRHLLPRLERGLSVERSHRRRKRSRPPAQAEAADRRRAACRRATRASRRRRSAAGALALAWLSTWRFAASRARLPRQQRRLLAVRQTHRLPRRAVDRGRLSPARRRRRVRHRRRSVGLPPRVHGPARHLPRLRQARPRARRSPASAPAEQRAVLRAYRPSVLRAARCTSPRLATFVCLRALHARRAHRRASSAPTRMFWTAPFAAFGLLRFYVLVQTPKGESPTEEIPRRCAVHAQPSDLGGRHHADHLSSAKPLARCQTRPTFLRIGRGRRRDGAACHR